MIPLGKGCHSLGSGESGGAPALLDKWGRARPAEHAGPGRGAATRAGGFPVGHASAQMAWRGLRSRPTWRILVYSNEDPPGTRGLVFVDGVDGAIVAQHVEDNPEDWSSDS